MTIAALSTAGLNQYLFTSSSNVAKSQQALQSLTQSLASGNLSAAQSAFNTYQALNTASGSGSASSSSSQSATDLTALGAALTAGNLTAAQSAFATVQNDLKNTPSQASANATAAVAQTVQWVDELLNFPDSPSASTATTDPVTSILDSAYGLNNSSSTTDPTVALLESKYGTGVSSPSPSTPASTPANGNAGSSASVNLYA